MRGTKGGPSTSTRRWPSHLFGDCGDGLYAAVDNEADVEMVVVAGYRELESVPEVERLAEVEASAQGTPSSGPAPRSTCSIACQ